MLADAGGLPVTDTDFLWTMRDRWFEQDEQTQNTKGEITLGELIRNLAWGAFMEGFDRGAGGAAGMAVAQTEWNDSQARTTTEDLVKQVLDVEQNWLGLCDSAPPGIVPTRNVGMFRSGDIS